MGHLTVGQVLETVGASERVMELLARPPAPQLAPGTVPPMESYRGHVRFENVSFRYPARPEVLALDNVSFSLAPGTVTGARPPLR
jgi:ABC-type multidrug transport system fused ATPase/permease subunit